MISVSEQRCLLGFRTIGVAKVSSGLVFQIMDFRLQRWIGKDLGITLQNIMR
jgi:hypothetical protein